MDNHPIPQDVTGFQFKLIGSMTIKQFGYVGAGAILSVAFFYAPIAWYLKFLLVPMFAVIGVSLAFLPVAGRPLDLMASYFFRALIRPNQFVYQKTGGSLSFMELSLHPIAPTQTPQQALRPKYSEASRRKEEQLMSYLYNTTGPANDLDKRESQFLTQLFSSPSSSQVHIAAPLNPPPDPKPQTSIDPQGPTAPLVAQSIQPNRVQDNTPPETSAQHSASAINSPLTAQIMPEIQNSNMDNQQAPTQPQPAHIEFPNLISGIVKDSRGNVLAGILIEVLNQNNESVRAFKTNALGQFASATQLTNGGYTIVFEDPKKQHTFTNIQLEANGSPLPPLTVISVDAREELRRSLFG